MKYDGALRGYPRSALSYSIPRFFNGAFMKRVSRVRRFFWRWCSRCKRECSLLSSFACFSRGNGIDDSTGELMIRDLMMKELRTWLSPLATDDELNGRQNDLELLVDAELNAEKGDYSGGLALYLKFAKDEILFLPVVRCALLMAIGNREKEFFNLLREEVAEYPTWCTRQNAALGVSLLRTWLNLILHIESVGPDWIVSLDYSKLPSAWQPIAAYLKVLSCLNTGDFYSGYVVAKILLEIKSFHGESFLLDLYLKRACAEVSRDLGRIDESRHWFEEMVQLACGNGWIRPFLGLSLGSRSIPMKVLAENSPKLRSKVVKASKEYLQSLVCFHNQVTAGNVTDELTPREFYVGMALKRGCTYKEIARNMEVSIGRVNILVRNLYQQLSIHSRTAIEPLVW